VLIATWLKDMKASQRNNLLNTFIKLSAVYNHGHNENKQTEFLRQTGTAHGKIAVA